MRGFFIYLIFVCVAVAWALFATLDAVDGLLEPTTTPQELDQ